MHENGYTKLNCASAFLLVEDHIGENLASGEGQGNPSSLATKRQGNWRENCNPGGLCGRGTRGGDTTATCDTRNSKKNDPDYCGQCKYGFRRPWMNMNDWCCTWDDFFNKRDCLCQAEYAPNCPSALSTSGKNQISIQLS